MKIFWSPFPTKRSMKNPRKFEENSEQNSGQKFEKFGKLSFCNFSGPTNFPRKARGSQKGFQKGGFGGCSPAPKTGTKVHSDVPWHQKPERGHIRMFPGTKNRNEGTFAETALLRNRPFVSSRQESNVLQRRCRSVLLPP